LLEMAMLGSTETFLSFFFHLSSPFVAFTFGCLLPESCAC